MVKSIVHLVSFRPLRMSSHTPFALIFRVYGVFLSDPHRLPCVEHNGDDHAAAFSSSCSSGVSENVCVLGFGKQMCHVPSALVTWCGRPPGLGEAQSLDGAQMQNSSTGSGTQACHVKVASSLKKLMISKSLEELARATKACHWLCRESQHGWSLDGDIIDCAC